MVYKKRQLSEFMGQEMIYDYLSKEIDESRKASFEEFLANNEEFQEEVEAVEQTLEYLDKLSQTQLSEAVLAHVVEKRSLFDWLSERLQWGKRSNPIKWAIEGTLVSIVVAGVVVLVPWNKIMQKPELKSYVLHEEKLSKSMAGDDSESGLSMAMDSHDHSHSDSQIFEPPLNSEQDPYGAAAGEKREVEKSVAEPKVKKQPTPKPEKVAKAAETVKLAVKEPVVEAPKKPAATHGFLYKMNIEVSSEGEVDSIATALRNKILENGGKKAGRVRLGWKKSDGSRYFHFILPEKKLDNFKLYLKPYGQSNLKKLIHPRIMGKGQVRLIMLVKSSAKSKPADSPSQPVETPESQVSETPSNTATPALKEENDLLESSEGE